MNDKDIGDSQPLKARQKIHEFVKQRLLGQSWQQIERFFDESSEEHRAVMRYADRICGVGSKPVIKGPPPADSKPGTSSPTTGADLFNPDEE